MEIHPILWFWCKLGKVTNDNPCGYITMSRMLEDNKWNYTVRGKRLVIVKKVSGNNYDSAGKIKYY